jgi:hypothetical protein
MVATLNAVLSYGKRASFASMRPRNKYFILKSLKFDIIGAPRGGAHARGKSPE